MYQFTQAQPILTGAPNAKLSEIDSSENNYISKYSGREAGKVQKMMMMPIRCLVDHILLLKLYQKLVTVKEKHNFFSFSLRKYSKNGKINTTFKCNIFLYGFLALLHCAPGVSNVRLLMSILPFFLCFVQWSGLPSLPEPLWYFLEKTIEI